MPHRRVNGEATSEPAAGHRLRPGSRPLHVEPGSGADRPHSSISRPEPSPLRPLSILRSSTPAGPAAKPLLVSRARSSLNASRRCARCRSRRPHGRDSLRSPRIDDVGDVEEVHAAGAALHVQRPPVDSDVVREVPDLEHVDPRGAVGEVGSNDHELTRTGSHEDVTRSGDHAPADAGEGDGPDPRRSAWRHDALGAHGTREVSDPGVRSVNANVRCRPCNRSGPQRYGR